jgi:PTS system glucose-specific IIC component
MPAANTSTATSTASLPVMPTAGVLSGAFLFKMFGLPAAAIAIWHTAKPENRVKVGGIMISAALTSFLTGITEPIEFAFLFVAPVLYFIHACLAASAQFVANSLDMHMGFTFSQGGIDFLMFNLIGNKSHNAWYVFILGPIYAVIYYSVFRFVILKFNLKTPGREDEDKQRRAQSAKTSAPAPWYWPLAAAATSPIWMPASPVCALR